MIFLTQGKNKLLNYVNIDKLSFSYRMKALILRVESMCGNPHWDFVQLGIYCSGKEEGDFSGIYIIISYPYRTCGQFTTWWIICCQAICNNFTTVASLS